VGDDKMSCDDDYNPHGDKGEVVADFIHANKDDLLKEFVEKKHAEYTHGDWRNDTEFVEQFDDDREAFIECYSDDWWEYCEGEFDDCPTYDEAYPSRYY
jgi:hypothetical protein